MEESQKAILDFEQLIYRREFHLVMNLLDTYIRSINKYWAKNIREAEERDDAGLRKQALADTFHMVRTATVLMHPIAPEGTEMILEYLELDERFWSWDMIFQPIYTFMDDPEKHRLKFLEPRVDFFKKHPRQIEHWNEAQEK